MLARARIRRGTARAVNLVTALALWLLGGCVAIGPPGAPEPPDAPRGAVVGLASWYGRPHHGRRTASGERFDMAVLTAAHRTLPLGTRVRVTHLRNGRSVVVRITDRGPYVPNRLIDLSRAAARALDMLEDGLAPVRLDIVAPAP